MATIADIIVLAIVVFALAITVVICLLVLDKIATNPAIVATMPAESMTILNQGKNTMKMFDWLIIMLTIGVGVASIASAVLIRTHPILFVATFIAQIVFTTISFVFTNAYASFAGDSIIAPYANQFPLLAILFQTFPLILLILSMLIAVATYGKPFGGNYNATI